MRKETRRLFNKRKRSEDDRKNYQNALTEYNKGIREARRESFRRLMGEIDDLPTAVRLGKLLGKDHGNGIGTMRRPEGSRTEGQKETLLSQSSGYSHTVPISVKHERLYRESRKFLSYRRIKVHQR